MAKDRQPNMSREDAERRADLGVHGSAPPATDPVPPATDPVAANAEQTAIAAGERAHNEAVGEENRNQAAEDDAARANEGSHGKALPGTSQTEAEAEAARVAERDRQAKAQNEADRLNSERNNSEEAKAVRAAAASVNANQQIMRTLAAAGAWQDPDGEKNPFFDIKVNVPAGRYRLRGRDHILTIKRDRIVAIELAGPKTDPTDITEFDAA